jgi:hypothetical protein
MMMPVATISWVCAVALFGTGIFLDMRRIAPGASEALYYTGIALAGVAVIALAIAATEAANW